MLLIVAEMSAMSSGLQFRLSVTEAPANALATAAAGPGALGPSLPWQRTRGGRSYVSRTEELKRRLGAAAATSASEQYGSFRNLTK